tara:strand:- start:891 stop:1193 length:303 start_codon:yes stop_codon:yes gene_type:complete
MSNKIYRLVIDTCWVEDYEEHHNKEMEYYSNFKSANEHFCYGYGDRYSKWCTLYEADYPNNIEDLVKLLNDENGEGWVEIKSSKNAAVKKYEEEKESNRW